MKKSKIVMISINILVLVTFLGSLVRRNEIKNARLINSVNECQNQGNNLKDYWDTFTKLDNQLIIDSILQSFDKFAQKRVETSNWIKDCGNQNPSLVQGLKKSECMAEGNQLKEYWQIFSDTDGESADGGLQAFTIHKELTLKWVASCNALYTVLVSQVLHGVENSDLPEWRHKVPQLVETL